jgi:cytidine deaminase
MPDTLYQVALAAAQKSYSPYSKFPVGVAIRTSDGRVYSGCNIENASYPEGWCAETTAISHMIMDGGGQIDEIAVLGLKADLCTPCGGCRQRLAEFGDVKTKVYLCNQQGVVETVTLGELLPKSFSL